MIYEHNSINEMTEDSQLRVWLDQPHRHELLALGVVITEKQEDWELTLEMEGSCDGQDRETRVDGEI